MHSSRRILSNPWNPRTFKDCDQQGEVPLHEEGGEVLGVLRGEDVQQDPAPHQVMKTNLTEVSKESKQMLVDNASGELEDIRNPRLLRWPDAGLEILHDTHTWLGAPACLIS